MGMEVQNRLFKTSTIKTKKHFQKIFHFYCQETVVKKTGSVRQSLQKRKMISNKWKKLARKKKRTNNICLNKN